MPTWIKLTAADLARVRFGISPVFEAVAAVRVLADPGAHAIHLPWVRWAGPRLADLPGYALLRRLITTREAAPVFLTPTPDSRMPAFEAELRRVRQADPDRVRESILKIFGTPRWVRALHDDPPAGLAVVADALRHCHDTLIAPHWPRMRAVLEADIEYRARELSAHGVAGIIAGLHRDLSWSDASGDGAEGVVIWRPGPPEEAIRTLGRGLVLCPSIFAWPEVRAARRPVGPGTLRYPARGAATVWQPTGPVPGGGLVALLGATRAALLLALDAPAGTTELARRLEVTPGAVSQHLSVLRSAGLVASQREGRAVLHFRTARADALIG